jgi:GNAT superfamily N-acetyltransferase
MHMSTSITEGYVPGCIGRVVQMHADFYSGANGFGLAFEAKVARELADFCRGYTAGRDGLWLVVQEGRIEGSIAIDGTRAVGAGASDGAHLRWFITSDAVKGQGCGKALLQRALDFVDACGYRSTSLWTFAGLGAARHLYESHGFRLAHESPGDQWGSVVTEQRFVRVRG